MNLFDKINWTNVLIVVGIVAVIAIVFTVIILVVDKYCKVESDPKISEVAENLAGANCGGCGYAGCGDFAKALVEGKAKLTDCSATSPENKKIISQILGVENTQTEPLMAVVKCLGTPELTEKKYNYVGVNTCDAKNAFMGGDKVCPNGCLGQGGCQLVCKFNAASVDNELAKINALNCSACGTCVKACPKGIIELIPKRAKVYIACSSKCKGKEVISACKVGCIGCGLCFRACPNGAITMIDNLPVIDYSKCTGCGICADKCSRKCIVKI